MPDLFKESRASLSFPMPSVREKAEDGRRRRSDGEDDEAERFPFCVPDERRRARLTSDLHRSPRLSLSNHCDLNGHVLHHSKYDIFASVNSLHWNEFHRFL